MAILNMNQLFDKLKQYIDHKIDNVVVNMQDLFDEYQIKLIVENLSEINIVANNIS